MARGWSGRRRPPAAAGSSAYAWPVTGPAPHDWLSRPVLEIVPNGACRRGAAGSACEQEPDEPACSSSLPWRTATSVLSRLLVSDDTAAMTAGAPRPRCPDRGCLGDRTEVTGTSGRPVAGGVDAGRRALGDDPAVPRGRGAPRQWDRGARRPGTAAPAPDRSARRCAASPRVPQVVTERRQAAASHLRVTAWPAGVLRVDAGASSQFATALLLVGPYGDDDLVVGGRWSRRARLCPAHGRRHGSVGARRSSRKRPGASG